MFFVLHIILPFVLIHFADLRTIQSPESNIVGTSSNVDSDNVMETQYANCRISSAQLIADAQATVTRVLTGGCNAKLINERFTNLERVLVNQITEIKKLIRAMPHLNDQTNIIPQRNNHTLYVTSPRQCEIEKYNFTLHELFESDGPQKLFTYYWCVNDVKNKISKWEDGRSERSNKFYIIGADYAMYMKFTPNYFPDGTIFVSVSLTKGQHDEHLTWPFSHHLRIEILDQSSSQLRVDRRSMIWNPLTVCPPHFWGRPGINGMGIDNPECVGLSIPKHILLFNNRYLWYDSLLIKLTIFL